MITYSIEKLVHFNCGYCKGWFSIADASLHSSYFCPHCGKYSTEIEKKENNLKELKADDKTTI